MNNSKVWAIAFLVLLVFNIGAVIYMSNKNTTTDIEALKTEKESLKKEYLENAKELMYLLETLLENSDELKGHMPEYRNIPTEEYEEALRKKVVRLGLKIEELEKQQLSPRTIAE